MTISPADSEYYFPIIMLLLGVLAIFNLISMSISNESDRSALNGTNRSVSYLSQNSDDAKTYTNSPQTIAHLITEKQLKSKNSLRVNYLICYLIVRASIWSKAPYLFIMYLNYHGLSLKEVGVLYIIDSVTATLVAPALGALTDKFGRKFFSILYNVLVITNLFLRITGIKEIAYIAQIMTGVTSGIVNTSYESWVVSESEKILPDEELRQRFLKKLFKK